MYDLKIIIASTRPGRKGPIIADWIFEIAKNYSEFNTELLDLAKINLPVFDEPVHPRLKKYEHQHTKDWSAKIEPSDAFIIVTPEYNFSFPASIKNAVDYLSQEWAYKPVGFVSYGGISAGTRAVQMLKQVLNALKLVTIPEAVNIPMFTQFIHEGNKFIPNEELKKGADLMIKELIVWSEGLKNIRDKNNIKL